MNIDVLIGRFSQWYGHTNFCKKKFTRNEYTYKLERGRQMRELLSREALREFIEQENWSEVCQRVIQSFSMSSGPLARWNEYQWVGELDTEEQRRFVQALEQFLYGDEPFQERLEQFETEGTGVYLRFRDRDPDQRRYQSKSLSWPFLSYFHFMMWPDQEYVFIKPTPLRKASRVAGFDIQYQNKRPVTYSRVQEFYRVLWPTVQRLGGRDWIDVQTLIHVAGEGFGVPEEGWIDEHHKSDPWAERIARWRLSPERIAARCQAEDEARKLLEDNLGRFDDEMMHRFLRLINTDFYEGQPRHDRFAPGFLGSIAKELVANLASFNDWSVRIWQSPESDLYDLLDKFWEQKAVPGAGISLPTTMLYLRDPSHYNVWLHYLADGLERITDFATSKKRSGATYQQYNEAVNQIRMRYNLQPQEVDVILWMAKTAVEESDPYPLASILTYVESSSYTFSPAIVTNYHLSLLTKPFAILTGLSGTGKTKLTRLYADAVYGIEESQDNPYYTIVAVRPDWTDNRGLLGYYNPLTHTYEATPFLRFMLRAVADPAHQYYVCLDEMNLARVEYYFSDFLSAMESGESVALHGQTECVATRSGGDIPETLPEEEIALWGYEVDGVLYAPPKLFIPPNLVISGTVNVDEATHAFSDKVLDRANSIEFNQVDLDSYSQRYRERYPDRTKLLDDVLPLLRQVYDLLEPSYLHFGYRTLEEVLGYLWQNETLPDNVRRSRVEALDNQLMQKISPKLRGDERIQETLEGLCQVLIDELGAESRSVVKLKWMIEELAAFGSTHFWR